MKSHEIFEKQPASTESPRHRASLVFFDCLRHTYTPDNKRDASPPGELHHSRYFDISFDIHTYTSDNKHDAIPLGELHHSCFFDCLQDHTTRVMQFPLGIAWLVFLWLPPAYIHIRQQAWCNNSPGELHHSCFFGCLRYIYTSNNTRDAIPPWELHHSCFFDCLRQTYTSDNRRDAIPPGELHHSCFFDCLRHTYTSDNKPDAISPGELRLSCFFDCLRHQYTSHNKRDAIPLGTCITRVALIAFPPAYRHIRQSAWCKIPGELHPVFLIPIEDAPESVKWTYIYLGTSRIIYDHLKSHGAIAKLINH